MAVTGDDVNSGVVDAGALEAVTREPIQDKGLAEIAGQLRVP
jgi:hypothetical protein